MARQKFENWKPKEASLALVREVDTVLLDFAAQGYTLTLRQVYYQLVAKDIIPNTTLSYDNLGALVTRARRAGLLDWSHMEDRTRNITSYTGYEDTADFIYQLDSWYQQSKWTGQDWILEAWVEKEALAGIIERGASAHSMPWMACRGYMADIEMYAAAGRIQRRHKKSGQRTVILHFGDHDPSGIDMTRDNLARLQYFGLYNIVKVERMALTMDQVEQYSPPPNPAKQTDCRFRDYQELYGDSSWELDALTPSVITGLIDQKFEEYVDAEKWENTRLLDVAGKAQMTALYEQWSEVEAVIGDMESFL